MTKFKELRLSVSRCFGAHFSPSCYHKALTWKSVLDPQTSHTTAILFCGHCAHSWNPAHSNPGAKPIGLLSETLDRLILSFRPLKVCVTPCIMDASVSDRIITNANVPRVRLITHRRTVGAVAAEEAEEKPPIPLDLKNSRKCFARSAACVPCGTLPTYISTVFFPTCK